MRATDNLFSLAVPLGSFLGTRIRVSVIMLVAVIAVVWRVQSFTTTVLFAAVLFLSVCLHELTHLWFLHRIKLRCSERILWPLGSLFAQAPGKPDPLVCLAGPGMNLALAVVAALQSDVQVEALTLLNPATCWAGLQSDNILTQTVRICFLVNVIITVANLIPARPMAGGYVLQSLLARRFSDVETRDILLRFGLVVSIFGLLAGFVFDLSGLTALSAFLLLLHVQEVVQWFQPTVADSNSYEYEFSAPYKESLFDANADEFHEDEEVPGSIVERWKHQRESRRDLRERELEQREHDELDRVLTKLHNEGREALTIAELRLLNRISARLRQKNH
jgi:Zn-dependent protease